MLITLIGSFRLAMVAYVAPISLLFASLANSQSIALTFDDGPNMADKIGLSPGDRNAAILRQLSEAHLKSILFVTRTDADSPFLPPNVSLRHEDWDSSSNCAQY